MKKFFVILLMIIFAGSIKATEVEKRCLKKLTNNFANDRQTFTLDLDQIQMRDYQNDQLAKTIRVVRELLDDLAVHRRP